MSESPASENPLFAPSTLPFQLPPFAALTEEHHLPALERGMAEHQAEIDAIVADPEPPTFDNTVAALERAGQLLGRASAAFFALAASDANEGIKAIETDISPRLAAHWDAIHMNRGLFDRLRQVEGGDAEETWVLERYRLDFVRAGAELSDDEQARLRELNQELTKLSTTFRQALQEASTAEALVVDDPAELDGMSPSAIEAIRQDDGTYMLPLLNFTNQPALAELTNRETRRRLYELSVHRAAPNREHAIRMATLRAERASLLGFPTHAAFAVADQTSKTVEAVEAMLGQLSGPAVANAQREAEALAEEAGHPIEPWDWSFYAEKVRKARFDFDAADMRPYFEVHRVYIDGVFRAATDLYGLTFATRDDLVGYHPDVRTFEVSDADGSPLGLFQLDPYARATKRGGAWMNSFVDQSHLLGEQPVVMNNLNITKPASGPTLLTVDEVTTAFHEFGHALHGLLSDVRFPRVSGTAVPRDFVEFPSQVNEMWATWPEVLATYARHHETGEPMPQDLVDKMRAAEQFNQGFATLEYLKAALLDWAWHSIGADEVVEDADAFEAAALEAAGVDFPLVGSRYRTTYFAHIFGGGYSAGYYSYIWSEVLDADTVEWFEENGGLTRANGDHFRQTLLSRGGSGDPMAAFRDFRGRDPRIEPLLAASRPRLMADDPLAPRLATLADAELVGRIAGAGFYEDPVLAWAMPDPATRLAKLTYVFTGSAVSTIADPSGEAWIVDDSCIALWRDPAFDRTADPAEERDGADAPASEDAPADPDPPPEPTSPLDEGDIVRLGVLRETLGAHHPHEPHWYLNIISTLPERRGRGLGAAVLEPVLARCDADGARAYLESTNPRNRTLYRRVGFVDADEIHIPDGPTLLAMWRDPRP